MKKTVLVALGVVVWQLGAVAPAQAAAPAPATTAAPVSIAAPVVTTPQGWLCKVLKLKCVDDPGRLRG